MGLAADVDQLLGSSPIPQQVDWIGAIRQEVAKYVTEMKGLRYMEPDDAMGWLSSVSARVLELMFMTLRVEGRVSTKLRVEELIPLRDELRYQYQISSRRLSSMKLEWDIAGGQQT